MKRRIAAALVIATATATMVLVAETINIIAYCPGSWACP